MLVFDQLRKNDPHLKVLAFLVLAGMGVLLTGLWYVQVVTGRRHMEQAQEQYYRTVRIPPIRGKILDRNRHVLADNRPCYNVNLYLEELPSKFRFEYTNTVRKAFLEKNPRSALKNQVSLELQREARYRVASNYLYQVSSFINEPKILIEEQFNRHYKDLRSMPLPLLTDLNTLQVSQFLEKSAHLPSLELEVKPLRFYRFGSLAAHLLGYLRREDAPAETEDGAPEVSTPDLVGVKGIEAAFESDLKGKAGVKSVLVNSMQYRQSEEIWASASPGKNVVLTLDKNIQMAADSALRSLGAEGRGAAVVLDVHTGDILAMASAPTFDPNDFLGRISPEKWQWLNDPILTPQVNRAAYGHYPPGSIFKIVVALACLEWGGLDPQEKYESKGFLMLGNRLIKDTAGAGLFDFRKAFYKSSNPYFIVHGLKVGPEKIVEMGRALGLGQKPGLATGQETAGYFPEPNDLEKKTGDRWTQSDTANLSIGQGELEVSPLQMAVMTAAIANGGKIIQPRVVQQVESQEATFDDQPIRFPGGQVRRTLPVSPRHLETIRIAMLDDVEHKDEVTGRLDGTGRQAAVPGFRVCGKTGTAQRKHGSKDYVVWFAAFAPFEQPRYAVVVVVEGVGGSGGGTCAPLAREIFQELQKREQSARSGPAMAVAP